MDDKAGGTASGSGGEEEWERGNVVKIQTIVGRWQGRSLKGSAGLGGGGEDNDWGYDQVPNEDRSDIDKQGMLQFIYFIMVSFSSLSYAVLTCSLVCIPTTGYIP